MIGETTLHLPPKADEPLAHKILEKLGEGELALRFSETLVKEEANY